MTDILIAHLSALLGAPIKNVFPLSGGDISQAYCLQTDTERFFCKTNNAGNAATMFATEKTGLETIRATSTIKVPRVYGNGKIDATGFLLLEFIEAQRPNHQDFERLGDELAQLHKVSADYFGWENDNFIGSLPQSNTKNTAWSNFFVKERLWPQFIRAQENRLLTHSEVPSLNAMLHICALLLQDINPSLLHGDLWSGNYLISSNGTPYLIDPAVYFGDAKVDMAMTRLFGGFSPEFYRAYEAHIPTNKWEQGYDDLYQLYYLLVHLNLFGRSYYPTVKKIVERYF
ncbi:fructosamine kinase family protein [Kriegella aquimaris]|uniref:Fructosamine-3-kinase n=1 Tax=Kriegella aquimaris TaxID=192904 RepID=A0A1G9Y955_9FLAO|nr:fructosamine kinase family protein [Kriegella aquimaris]SDN04973.1 Fructosamine-3-kinase [Kriegella aquimaris]